MRLRILACFVLGALFLLEPAPRTVAAESAQSRGELRAALDRAVAQEKAHPSKDSALAVGASETGTYHIMVAESPAGGCIITCPANIIQSNDPNQCGAVVSYPAPTADPVCGTITCAPASGSFFPKGTTPVNCSTTAGPTCNFTVTVNDLQPPTIACPPNQTGVANGSLTPVTFPPPTANDNCPGLTAVCNPPSGSSFPVGTTTVTCTATDAVGNTATCTFTVTLTAPVVPALSPRGLIALGLLLAAVGLFLARNRLSGG